MTFSFSATPDFDFLVQFAQQIQAPINNGLMLIPEWLGEGYIHKLKFGIDFKLVIYRYVLNEKLTIKRNSFGDGNDLVNMFFYNNEKPVQIAHNNDPYIRVSQQDGSSIQITSNDMSSSINFPAYHHINYVVVGVQASRL